MDSCTDLLARAWNARTDGDLDAARQAYALAERAARISGLEPALVSALNGIAQVDRDLGHFDQAVQGYVQALRHARPLQDTQLIAYTLRHLADVLLSMGDSSHATSHIKEAIGLYRSDASSAVLDLANALRIMALANQANAEYSEALRSWREAVALYQQAGVEAAVSECRTQIQILENQGAQPSP